MSQETVTAAKFPTVVEGPWPNGALKHFSEDELKFLDEQVPKHDGIFEIKSFFFGKVADFNRMYFVTKPDYVQHILQKNNRNYKKSHAYSELKHLMGNGLLNSEGDFWRKQRRLMQPAFHKERLAGFAQIMTEECQVVIDKWKALPDGSEINLSADMLAMTLQIICRAMFSSDATHLADEVNREFAYANEKLVQRITNPLSIPLWLPTPGNIKERQSYERIRSMVDGIIQQRLASGKRYDDLLAMLMEMRDADTGEGMSEEQLRDEVVTMFIAGHETTGVALTWLLHCLDENPEAADKLLAEEQDVLNGRTPQVADTRTLRYTRMVIDETLRLYPPAWIIGRHSLEEDQLGDYTVPKDTNCLIPVYAIHRDARYWDDPTAFKPERFAEPDPERPKFAYLPFGGGPRLCIGNNFALMEMQLTIPMLLREFKLSKADGFQFKPNPLITMRPEPDMRMLKHKY